MKSQFASNKDYLQCRESKQIYGRKGYAYFFL